MSKPSSNQIRLRVAGIFYDRLFSVAAIPVGPTNLLTIESVMDFARLTTPLDYGFEFRAAALNLPGNQAKKSMIKIAHRIESEFISLGGKTRKSGLYDLEEVQIPGGVVAWQYYVARESGSASTSPPGELVSSPTQPAGSSFTPYNEMPVQGGDTIIWRMVAIRTL
jgi:hypothetical protein